MEIQKVLPVNSSADATNKKTTNANTTANLQMAITKKKAAQSQENAKQSVNSPKDSPWLFGISN